MYSFKSRVRYSEIDRDKKMDMYSIINYFQDCSTFQSEDIGMGLTYLEKNKRVWLMNAWQIIVNRFPALGEEITVSTWAYDFNNMYGYRNFLIEDSKGLVTAAANSIWVYMDTESLRPVKVTEADVRDYHPEPKFDMDYAPRKITLPKTLEPLTGFLVTRSNIDTNDHVNNGQYIKMAEEFLPAGFAIGQMRAEYRMSAVLGDVIVPMVCKEDTTYTVVLANTEGKPFTIIEFKQQEVL
ncbi:thioesterase [Anaerocolumna sp. AGMB13025]|uniref:acyl-[acyl-carrier-protein] thioesterase n=1 Tax=Anaerocolumna sp. AGMB13025 TaxID=3039116 RepID=UPI00241E446A|nr:acyl-ACP thioesterase domain-containing protein [Anaerocolumna sp. AGMB13025]WFR57820.1 thioesterase [Anaerocolumna sp. AGMB13025]